MKIRHFLFAVTASILLAGSCSEYDDSELVGRIESLENKVSNLEKLVSGINSDIAALKLTLEAVANEDVVVRIKAIEENGKAGFEVTYRKSGTVKIFLDTDSSAPELGVKEVGGVLYWTWNGSPLLNASGKMIPAEGKNGANGKDGVTPQFKIENGYWYVSYDEGKEWIKLDKATSQSTGSSLFRSADIVDGNLVLVLNNGTILTIPVASIEKPTSFDENSIVLSVAAISDVHIGNGYGSEAKFTSALNQLKNRAAEKDPDGLDGVMVVGDLVNTATNSQITTFKNLYEAQLDPVKVPMIYTIGNHDMNPNYKWTASTVQQNAVFHSILGEDYFLTDQDETMRTSFECRHCIVSGYHILAVTPNGTSPIVYNYNVLTWLDSQLKAITEAEPDKYVIVLTHPMIYNTCYGSLLQDTYTTLGEYWSTKALSETLGKYPQVITFGGHLHFPLNDPRSIWQGEFTALGCASTSYMAIENGAYENMTSTPTVMNDAGEFSQGLLVQFDANGFVRFTRMDFYNQTVIGQPWEANPPVADKSHLEKYNHTALKSTNTAPVLSDISVNGSTVTFAAGTDDEFVHHYVVTLRQGSSVIATKRVLADFYKVPQTSMMKKSHSVSFGSLADGEYTVSVIAIDSWDAQSDPLEKSFTVGANSKTQWTSDAAGSQDYDGGSGSVSGSWLSYAGGKVSWTANTTGKPRIEQITLPNGEMYKVVQVEAADFKGAWSFRTQRFSNNPSVVSAASDVTFDLSFTSALYGETLSDIDGKNHTNTLGVRGLYLDAIADATVEIDYVNGGARFGLFLDERKAQPVSNGKAGYPYVCFIPECATAWMTSPWNFVPVPIHSSKNYTWLWFNVSSDLSTLNYDQPNKQYLPGTSSGANMIIGITCAVCASATPAASDINTTYDVIYQANPNKENTNGGFTLTRK